MPGGGGGGTQIWFWLGCATEAAKPVSIFKGNFGGKGYPLIGGFIQENFVFVYFSDEMDDSTVEPRYKEVGYNQTLLYKQGNFAGPVSLISLFFYPDIWETWYNETSL